MLRPQAVILLLALATPLPGEGAETFCPSGSANECTASLVSKLPSRRATDLVSHASAMPSARQSASLLSSPPSLVLLLGYSTTGLRCSVLTCAYVSVAGRQREGEERGQPGHRLLKVLVPVLCAGVFHRRWALSMWAPISDLAQPLARPPRDCHDQQPKTSPLALLHAVGENS